MTKPIRVLSLGAGVQSTTILFKMLHGEIEPAEHVIFSDTGWEPAAVYEHLNKLVPQMEAAGMQFHRVSRGNLREDYFTDGVRFASIPLFLVGENGKRGMARRQCTTVYKLEPLLKKQREIAGLKKRQRSKEHLITTIIGISYDESHRMKDPAFSWIKHEYPLVDAKVTREDCIKWCEEMSLPKPPRSACIGCPYHNNREWLEIKKNPAEWADAVDFDARLRTDERMKRLIRGTPYLHEHRIPLDQVIFDKNAKQEELFGAECEGLCGI
jgi:hypothetical protein